MTYVYEKVEHGSEKGVYRPLFISFLGPWVPALGKPAIIQTNFRTLFLDISQNNVFCQNGAHMTATHITTPRF